MPRYGVTIRKSTSFRGSVQHFSNTYFFDWFVPSGNTATLEALVDDVVDLEKEIHGTNVAFTDAKLWITNTGSRATNVMIVDKPLTGSGQQTPTAAMDKERAYLLQIPAGTDTLGRPVKLRKWYHTCSPVGPGLTPDNNMLAGVTPLSSAAIARVAQMGQDLRTLTPAGVASPTLTSQTGRALTGPSEGYKWLEHHQLGDEWRSF
jgi:hypothetical protein